MFAFILNKLKKVNYIGFTLWLISSIIVMLSFTQKFNIKQFFTNPSLCLGTIMLFIFIMHIILQKLNIYNHLKIKYPTNMLSRLPDNILSIIIGVIILIIGATILLGPEFLIKTFNQIGTAFFNPTNNGRWVSTVAENQQPYFVQWAANFGTSILYLFLISSIFFIRKTFSMLNKKEINIITCSYIFLLLGVIYSRYMPNSIFNGENFISKAFYIISILAFIGILIYYYLYYNKNSTNIFNQINFGDLFLLVFFILTLFTARSAVRLIMVLTTIAPIFIAFIIAELGFLIKEGGDSTKKIFLYTTMAVVLLISCSSGYQYYQTTTNQAYNYAPYYYTYQWQETMSWVRDNTPTNSVFESWWDYGYWIQSIGNRATVTDGGNSIVYWNYLIGRDILTGDDQKDALEFSYTHNVSYLLIDSSDIGKYGAFSQIGSDANLDRLSQGPITLLSDQKQIQETKTDVIRNYNIPAGNGQIAVSPIEEDVVFDDNGTQTSLFRENSGLLGVTIRYSKDNESSIYLKQPQGLFISNGKQITIPLRYLYYEGQIRDFKTGINATAYIIQNIYDSGQGLQLDNFGAMIYISPRVMKGMLGQVYLLNDPFNNFPAFKLSHSQPDFILQQISNQGVSLDEFVDYNGIRGPIKIWKINYNGDEIINPKYLNTTFPPEITWKF